MSEKNSKEGRIIGAQTAQHPSQALQIYFTCQREQCGKSTNAAHRQTASAKVRSYKLKVSSGFTTNIHL